MTRVALAADPAPSDFVAIIDSREQLPFVFDHLRSCRGTLPTGDYSLVGLECQVALERKSLADFLSCCAGQRDRFEAECQRLLAYPCRGVVLECSWADLERGEWRSQIESKAVVNSALGWIAAGIPIIPAGDRTAAQRYTERILYIAARRCWREARGFLVAQREEISIKGATP